jgi:ferric-dicitrate binding protein FerR (iron transport regulator)
VGRAARANQRSLDGGKPRTYVAFQRCLRACRTFGDDRAAFHAWLASTSTTEAQCARMQEIWDALHPELVTLHDRVPESLRA